MRRNIRTLRIRHRGAGPADGKPDATGDDAPARRAPGEAPRPKARPEAGAVSDPAAEAADRGVPVGAAVGGTAEGAVLAAEPAAPAEDTASAAEPGTAGDPAPVAPAADDAPDDGPWAPPGAPGRPGRVRTRMSRTDPWSVLTVSFLVSTGLVVCTAVTLPPLWTVLGLLGRDPWPPPAWQLGLAVATVVPATLFTTLCAFCYNLSARCVGGVELTLAEGPPDTLLPDATAAGPPPGP
ncbi:DUF3566 domain-containing protein [Streptomyces sp. NPDC018610]|uniref:DUF3566 domain-containing protein n=1 Tax=Streptomyces sp. NPDC018610 TaxID=3365049 RepID=UPI00379E2BA5